MSATITLYEPVEGVTLVREEFEFPKWSDGKEHTTIQFYKTNKKTMNTRSKRMGKYFRKMKELFPEAIFEDKRQYRYNSTKHFVIDPVLYRQGWFFTEALMDVSLSKFYAFDKNEAHKLLDKMIDKTSVNGNEAYSVFTNRINEYTDNEHFILEISW